MSTTKFNGKQHQVKVVTPTGVAMWASLKTPKKFKGDDKSNFMCDLQIPEGEAKSIINQCEGVIEALIADMPKKPRLSIYKPWRTHEDDAKVPEGVVQFKFKQPYFPESERGPETKPIKTVMYQGTGKNGKVEGSVIDWDATNWMVGNGSTVQIGGYIRPYFNNALGLGVSLRLEVMLVHELKKFEGESSDDFADLMPSNAEAQEKSTSTKADASVSDSAADLF